MAEYSYLVLNLPRGTSRDAARRILTDHAEYGHWELSKLRLYPDGSRKATLRRRVIRQARAQLSMMQWPPAARGGLGRASPGRLGARRADRGPDAGPAGPAGPPGAADGPAQT
jgi:Family of unknown function (DUF5703)